MSQNFRYKLFPPGHDGEISTSPGEIMNTIQFKSHPADSIMGCHYHGSQSIFEAQSEKQGD